MYFPALKPQSSSLESVDSRSDHYITIVCCIHALTKDNHDRRNFSFLSFLAPTAPVALDKYYESLLTRLLPKFLSKENSENWFPIFSFPASLAEQEIFSPTINKSVLWTPLSRFIPCDDYLSEYPTFLFIFRINKGGKKEERNNDERKGETERFPFKFRMTSRANQIIKYDRRSLFINNRKVSIIRLYVNGTYTHTKISS